MKLFFYSILVLFFLSGCGHIQMFKDWDMKDTTMMAASLGLTFVDYRQTLNIADRVNEGYYEKYNSFALGEHPSRSRINTWFICSALTKTLIAGLLPKNGNAWFGVLCRENWLVLNIGISGGLIHRNYEIGLEVNF